MTCTEISELLPWLLNRSLDATSREEVAAHLEECESCRQELEEASAIGKAAAQHLPAPVLVALALGEPTDPLDASVVAAHLGHCASCRVELELAKESFQLEQGEGRSALPAASTWRNLALAASIAGLVLGGGWWWTFTRLSSAASNQRTELTELEASLEILQGHHRALLGEAEGLRRRAAERLAQEVPAPTRPESRPGGSRTPEINLPVLELFPSDAVLRGATGEENTTVQLDDSSHVVLLLMTDDITSYDAYRLELRDVDGRRRWQSDGLRRQAGGDFSLLLPTPLLSAGPVTLELSARHGGSWRSIGTYRLRASASGDSQPSRE